LVASVNIVRDSLMSPESKDSFNIAAEDSPGSQHSFSINTMPLPDDLDAVMDMLASPADQEDFRVDADMSSEGGSSSPQSQYSYGINSMVLPEPQDTHFLPAVHIPGVQDEGTELSLSQHTMTLGVGAAPLPVAQKSDVSAIPIHMEDLQADFTQPTKHERHFGDPLATLRNLGVELTSPTKVEGVTDDHPAVCGKPCIHCLQNTPNFCRSSLDMGRTCTTS
jgi:hypothetical protein